MQVSKIALSVALALGAVSANAASTGIPTTGVKVIYMTGASGTDSFLETIASGLLNVTKYVKATSASDYQAWYGTAKSGAIDGVASGTQILFIKRSKGGSAFGVGPLARGQKLAVLDVQSASCTLDSTNTRENYTCPVIGTDFGAAGDAGNAGLVPDFGVSDVEPGMFIGRNVELGTSALTNAEISSLVAQPWAQLAQGIAVTNAVATSTVITRTGLRNLMTKASSDWSLVDGTTDPLVVCRRSNGSGTQAAFNWYNTGFPCTSAYNGSGTTTTSVATDSLGRNTSTAGTSLDPWVLDPSQSFAVVENTSSGDVRACLSSAQRNQDFTHILDNGKTEVVKFSNAGAKVSDAATVHPYKAIGVLSLDSYNRTSTANNQGYKQYWYFHNLDGAGSFDVNNQTASVDATGIAPSRANIITGAYDFVIEPTLQYKNGSAAASDAIKMAFFNTVQTKLADPANMTSTVATGINPVPFAYASLPQLYTPGGDINTNPVAINSREANTCSYLHPAF